MKMKVFLKLRIFRCLFFLVIVLFGFSLIIGSGGGDDNSDVTCTACENNSDCGEGYWCASFVSGPSRCVPNSIGINDPYTCTVTY